MKILNAYHHLTECFSWIVLEYAYSYCTLVLEEVSNKPVVLPERYGRNNNLRRWSPRQHGPLCQVLCIHNLLLHIPRHHSFRTYTGMLKHFIMTIMFHGANGSIHTYQLECKG